MTMRKISLTVLLFFTMLSNSGCWDSKDIDRLAFPIAAAYDVHQNKSDLGVDQLDAGPLEEPQVDITALSPNLSPQATAPFTVETIPASSIGYARDKRSYTSPEYYVTGFNKVILAGEDLARQGLNQPLESLYRFPQVSHTMVLAVVEGRGEDVLEMPVQNYENMGLYLYALLEERGNNGFMPTVNLHEFENWQSPGRNPVLPLLKMGGVNKVFLGGVAVFNKDRMIAKLDIRQTRALMLLRGISAQGYLPFSLPDEGMKPGVALLTNKRNVNVEQQGNSYVFKININLQGEITEHPSNQPVGVEHVNEIENFIAGEVRQDCDQLVEEMQNEWQVDCIDIDKYAMANWRRELKNSVDSSDFISNATIEVQVKVNITNAGEKQ